MKKERSTKNGGNNHPSAGQVPAGRPADGEERPPLKSVTFKADPATLDALKRLEDALPRSVRAKKSTAIRGALLETAATLRARASSTTK